MHHPQTASINSALATSPIASSVEDSGGAASATPLTPPNPRGSTPSDGVAKLVNCTVDIVATEWPVLQLKMRLQMSTASASKEVKFPFNLQQDTVAAVLDEMIREGVLDEGARIIGNSALEECLREPMGMPPPRSTNTRPIEASSVPSQAGVQYCAEPPLTGTSETGSVGALSGCTLSAASSGNPYLTPGSVPPGQNNPTSGPTTYELLEDAAVQDHPEVAALLLRQKKEIELLALFHRREHQALLKSLKKQLCGTRARIDSSAAVRAGVAMQNAEESGLPLPDGEDRQFMTKVRRLLYESTGNAAWLSDQPQPAGLNENGGVAL